MDIENFMIEMGKEIGGSYLIISVWLCNYNINSLYVTNRSFFIYFFYEVYIMSFWKIDLPIMW